MEEKIGDLYKTNHYLTSTSWKRAVGGITTESR